MFVLVVDFAFSVVYTANGALLDVREMSELVLCAKSTLGALVMGIETRLQSADEKKSYFRVYPDADHIAGRVGYDVISRRCRTQIIRPFLPLFGSVIPVYCVKFVRKLCIYRRDLRKTFQSTLIVKFGVCGKNRFLKI